MSAAEIAFDFELIGRARYGSNVTAMAPSDAFEGIIGQSQNLRKVLDQVATVAGAPSTVLIQGETGTGKEMIARAILRLSERRSRPYVTLNCAAIPAGLLEGELFGHERGAFTGAFNQRMGRFELANKGTLFLDEIGEVPLELQGKFLRVLQEQEFERLGGSHTQRVDVRLIAATNCDLASMAHSRKFRADLYYRLSVFPIYLPPLRERPEDIPLLVRHFLRYYSERMKKRVDVISQQVMEAFKRHSWPGNIRELQNFIERSVILSKGPVLNVPLDELREAEQYGRNSNDTSLEQAQRKHILHILQEAGWVVGGRNGAAARLGMPRTTLISVIRRLGIERPGVSSEPDAPQPCQAQEHQPVPL